MTAAAKTKGNGKGAVVLDPAPPVTDESVAPVAEAEEGPNKVLDLTALNPTRRRVKLPTAEKPDGDVFELRLLDDFGIRDQQRLLSWSRQYDELFNSVEDLDEEQSERMEWLLNAMFEMVLDAPKAKISQMSDPVKNRVVTAFSLAPLLAQQEREAAARKKAEADAEAEAAKSAESLTSES